MAAYLVDTCVVADLTDTRNDWFDWSAETLSRLDYEHNLCINPVIYAECSLMYETIEVWENALEVLGFAIKEVPREALFLAGRAFLQYRRSGGSKKNVLTDFFIGAHAAVEQFGLITRDKSRFSTYFPSVTLVMPDS